MEIIERVPEDVTFELKCEEVGAGGEEKCILAEETALAEGGSVVGGFLGRLRN